MWTVICFLVLCSLKDDISAIVELYTTLNGNLKVYAINYIITATVGTIETYFDYWIYFKINQDFWMYFKVMSIVNIVGMIMATIVIANKNKIRKFITKKKRIKALIKARKVKHELNNEDYRDIDTKMETLTKGEMK